MGEKIALIQALIDLREQLTADYTGDFEELKTIVDKLLLDLLKKINEDT